MRLYRVATTGPTWEPDDLSGAGASIDPGRWNRAGEKVVYCATTLALAVLETAAHIDAHGLPLNRYVIEVDVPDAVWAKRLVLTPHDLRVGWDAVPSGMVSQEIGSAWYTAGAHALLELPSAIIPEETVVVLSAAHADAGQVTAAAVRPFTYDRLFRTRR